MDELPIELIHYILYDKLEYDNVIKCYITSKIFHVLNERELNILQNTRYGYLYCIRKKDLQAFQRCIKNKNIKDCFPIFQLCCWRDRVDFAKWMVEYANSIGSPINIHEEEDDVFVSSLQEGRTKIVQWLIEYANSIGSPFNIHEEEDGIIECCCFNGHFEIAKWMIEYANSIGSPYNLQPFKNEILMSNCKHKNVKFVEWLIDYFDGSFDIDYETLFRTILIKGFPEIVEVLIKKIKDAELIFDNKIEFLFRMCCQQLNVRTIEWMFNYAKNKGLNIDIHANDENAIIIICSCGNYYIAKWLLDYAKARGDPINIHIRNDMIFKVTRMHGHSHIIKLLEEYK